MTTLAAIVAIEKSVKARATSEGGKLHRNSQNPKLYYGFTRHYSPVDDEGEKFPPEETKVQLNAIDVLRQFSQLMSKYFDITLTKDQGNTTAKADIVVGGKVIASEVPATTLIFLEKQLENVRTFLDKLPTLDSSEIWVYDSNSDLYHSKPTTTHKTRKVQRPIVMYDATPEHPAQTQLISEDVTIGHWNQIRRAGALPNPVKVRLLERVNSLQEAVKRARVKANTTEVKSHHIGDAVFDFVFQDL